MSKDDNLRVSRGGGWFNAPAGARVAGRGGHVPSSRYHDLGFRLARVRTALERLADVGKEVSHGAEAERA